MSSNYRELVLGERACAASYLIRYAKDEVKRAMAIRADAGTQGREDARLVEHGARVLENAAAAIERGEHWS